MLWYGRLVSIATLVALTWQLGCTHSAARENVEPHIPIETDAVPWTSLEVDDSNDDFDFVVVTDRTGEHRDGVFESAMPKVDLLRPAFVMSVGDLIEGYSEDRAVLDAQWEEFEGFIEQLGMPFFYLGGNHDLSNETMAHVWRERFGPTYYHFVYKGVLFLALNSELFSMVSMPGTSLPGPDLQAEQMAWAERILADHPDVRWTLVFVHQPLWDSPRIHPDWLKIEEWLGDRAHTVFAGHTHEYTLSRRNGREYITLATTGGISPMRGVPYGEFDHVAHVSMRKDGPVIANLLLDGIQPVDVVDTELRARMQRLEKSVRATPMRFEGDSFGGGAVTFAVHNDEDTPLQLQATIHPSRDLEPSEPEIAVEIAPNSVGSVVIPLMPTALTPFESLAPTHASWQLRSAGPNGETIEVALETSIAPERLFDCYEPQRPIEIDGSLLEWDVLAFVADPPAVIEHADKVASSDDASFRFDVRCDEEWLYFGIGVRDDSIVSSPDRIAREQDHVNVTLDSRDEPARSSGGQGYFAAIEDGTFRGLVLTSAGPEPNPANDDVLAVFMPPPPEGIRSASRVGDAGYTDELAIPVAVLDEKRGGRFDHVRLEVSIYDFDEGEPGHAVLWWRPSRFSPQSIPGSGTFVRH